MTIQRIRRTLGLAMGLAVALTATGALSASAAASAADLLTEVRALGMGGAFVGLADDEAATRFNPAGLAFFDSRAINVHYNRQFGSANAFSLVGALPHFGGGLRLVSTGGIEGRNANDETTSTFSYTDVALTAANGWALSDLGLGLENLAIGSRLTADIASTRNGGGFGGGLDLGVLWRSQRPGFLPLAEMRAGMSLRNAPGTGPFSIKTGIGARPISALAIALDVGFPLAFHLGGEFSVTDLPSPLSGLDVRAGTFVEGSSLSLTFGFGVGVASFRVDYAFASHSVLPGTHRLAVVWTF
ncbi:MAG: hypothetical protein ABEK03_07925 [Candidatus Bipolaricaulia bacterium]